MVDVMAKEMGGCNPDTSNSHFTFGRLSGYSMPSERLQDASDFVETELINSGIPTEYINNLKRKLSSGGQGNQDLFSGLFLNDPEIRKIFESLNEEGELNLVDMDLVVNFGCTKKRSSVVLELKCTLIKKQNRLSYSFENVVFIDFLFRGKRVDLHFHEPDEPKIVSIHGDSGL